MSEGLTHVELYTDGACSGNPGPGGWAYILKHPGSGAEKEASGGEPSTTNNRMELMSVIEGLKSLERPCRVELYSDSQYVVKGLREWMDEWKRKGWKRGRNEPVKNIELWKQLDDLRRVHQITYHWIRGHNEHPENERCDRLAVAAIEQFRNASRTG
jgi:ribonuclease HI